MITYCDYRSPAENTHSLPVEERSSSTLPGAVTSRVVSIRALNDVHENGVQFIMYVELPSRANFQSFIMEFEKNTEGFIMKTTEFLISSTCIIPLFRIPVKSLKEN